MAIDILETVLYTDDLPAAESFYAEVLGLEVQASSPGRHVFFRCERQMLLIFAPAETAKPSAAAGLPIPTHEARGPGHVCFRATAHEIDRWRVKLLKKGVTIDADFNWPTGGRSIYFRDPAGNSLEFAEPRIWNLD